MTTDSRIREIQNELIYLESRLSIPTLPHSDQQLLAEAWDLLQNELDELENIDPWNIQQLESPPGSEPVARPPTPIPDRNLLLIDYSAIEHISEEELERMNNTVDDRCAYCPGCVFCRFEDETYDPSGEI